MLIPNLSVLLAERRLTLSKVSADTGISRTTLTALSGRAARGIQFATLNALCQYLRVTPNDLFIYRPFDLSLAVAEDGAVTFTLTGAGGAAERFTLACDAREDTSPDGALRALRLRLSPPEDPAASWIGTAILSMPSST
jgi:DNA-binding Xre family transcriptional regulator